jgi:DNA-binding PadR family transcriptional regulator
MSSEPRPDEMLPLTVPVYYTLLALADGERHGYAIITEVEERTGGAVRLRTGTLYTAIRRMLEQGLVAESDERPDPELDDERRRYYRITPFGREVLALEAARLEQMVALAREKKVLARPGGGA